LYCMLCIVLFVLHCSCSIACSVLHALYCMVCTAFYVLYRMVLFYYLSRKPVPAFDCPLSNVSVCQKACSSPSAPCTCSSRSSQLVRKHAVRDSIKSLTTIQRSHIHHLPFTHQAGDLLAEGHQVGETGLSLCEPTLTRPDDGSVLDRPFRGTQEELCHRFPGASYTIKAKSK